MDFVKLLKENPNLVCEILSIILVYDDKRPAYLLDDIDNDEDNNIIDDIISFFSLNKIDIHPDCEYSSYLISKNKIEIPRNCIELGRVLGMTYLNNDFRDYTKFRKSFHIYEKNTNTHIYNEIVNDTNLKKYHKIFKERIQSFNDTMKKYKLPYHFYYKLEFIIGTKTRQKKLKDLKYIQKNLNKYFDDFWCFEDLLDKTVLDNLTAQTIYDNFLLFNTFYNEINSSHHVW